MGYRKDAVVGFSSQTGLKIVNAIMSLVKIMILARLLTPGDFGTFSLVTIALGVSEAFTETGVNVTIVQSKRPVTYFLDTAWVIAIGRGCLIGMVMIGLGCAMSYFFQQPELVYLVSLAALVPVIKGFINPAIIGMYKSLHFFSDSIYRFGLMAMDFVASVALVWLFQSVFAWIAALVATATFEVVISFVFFQSRPTFRYISSRAAIIFRQAHHFSLSSVFSYLNENSDNFLIGRLLGVHALGLYQNAYSLSHQTTYEISRSIHHGTLPIYTKMVDDHDRIKRAAIKTMAVGIGLMTLGAIPLLIAPTFFINFILGEQWLETIPLIRWLVVAGWLQGLVLMSYTVLYARNQLKLLNWHASLSFLLLILLVMILGSLRGLTGAVAAVALSRLLSLPYLAWILHRTLRSTT